MTKKAALLVNLGSPAQVDTSAVRSYLDQFLMDPYVIQCPWLLRRLIVSLFVLPKRPRTSAQAYRSIWWDEGSPLIVLSTRLQQAVQKQTDIPVALAMRYGQPCIENQLHQLAQQKIEQVLFIPLYPHFADSTVTTSVEEARRVIKQYKLKLELTVQPPFYAAADYIKALFVSARPYLEQDYDHIVFSYHGLPKSHITKRDPSASHCLQLENCCQTPHEAHRFCYRHQIIRTTECFVKQARLDKQHYTIAFQSRLGRAAGWLDPNTEDVLNQLAQRGKKNILVICPAFVTDCLETLEEIAIKAKEKFTKAGGESLTLIPCLNTHPQWVSVLADWCNRFARL